MQSCLARSPEFKTLYVFDDDYYKQSISTWMYYVSARIVQISKQVIIYLLRLIFEFVCLHCVQCHSIPNHIVANVYQNKHQSLSWGTWHCKSAYYYLCLIRIKFQIIYDKDCTRRKRGEKEEVLFALLGWTCKVSPPQIFVKLMYLVENFMGNTMVVLPCLNSHPFSPQRGETKIDSNVYFCTDLDEWSIFHFGPIFWNLYTSIRTL